MLREAATAGSPFDLALLDWQMSDMDGLTLSQFIKADVAFDATRLVVLAPLGKAKSDGELKRLGIEDCLVKPVKQSRLFDCMTMP